MAPTGADVMIGQVNLEKIQEWLGESHEAK
jgi:hypothetical protein